MSYRLEIRPEALTDIETAAEWYDTQQPGLGKDFAHTILAAIDKLPSQPLIHQLRNRRQNVRWLRLQRFPYRVVYRMSDDLITVFAVLHVARQDRHWKRRL